MENEVEKFDYIVVGAGIEGSAAAYYLAKNGHKTMLLEQFQLQHNKGSSHGNSRITRKAYNEDIYTQMMLEAYGLWDQLAKEAGEKLFENCGALFMAPKKFGMVEKYTNAMDKYSLKYTVLDGKQIREKFSFFDKIPDHFTALYDPDAGLLLADMCLFSFHSQFAKNGGVIRDNEKVHDIFQYSSGVTVKTIKKTYQCKSVILCLGAWSGQFLKEKLNCTLPLQPKAITVCYWQETKPGLHSAVNGTPAVVLFDDDGEGFFSLPSLEYRGLVKLCYDFGPQIDPDRRNANEGIKESVDKARSCLKRFYTGLTDEPMIVHQCLYTYTPDHHLILDRHPTYKNVIIGAGFSGHGFKLAPVVGKILGSLALGRDNHGYNLNELCIERFEKMKPKPSSTGVKHHML
jgi:sarcosine oxidase/L-pipecolate oxidase